MIQSKVFYAVKCDCCGDLYEGEDYSYWPTAGDVESYAQDGDWITHEGGHVCPDCYEIGDDDEIELNKPFIKPEIEKPKTDLDRFKEMSILEFESRRDMPDGLYAVWIQETMYVPNMGLENDLAVGQSASIMQYTQREGLDYFHETENDWVFNFQQKGKGELVRIKFLTPEIEL